MTDVDSLPDWLQEKAERLYDGAGYPTAEEFVEAAVDQHVRRTLKRYPHLDTEYRYRTKPQERTTTERGEGVCAFCGADDKPLHERVIETGGNPTKRRLTIIEVCGCWQPKGGPHPAEEKMLAALGSDA